MSTLSFLLWFPQIESVESFPHDIFIAHSCNNNEIEWALTSVFFQQNALTQLVSGVMRNQGFRVESVKNYKLYIKSLAMINWRTQCVLIPVHYIHTNYIPVFYISLFPPITSLSSYIVPVSYTDTSKGDKITESCSYCSHNFATTFHSKA